MNTIFVIYKRWTEPSYSYGIYSQPETYFQILGYTLTEDNAKRFIASTKRIGDVEYYYESSSCLVNE